MAGAPEMMAEERPRSSKGLFSVGRGVLELGSTGHASKAFERAVAGAGASRQQGAPRVPHA